MCQFDMVREFELDFFTQVETSDGLECFNAVALRNPVTRDILFIYDMAFEKRILNNGFGGQSRVRWYTQRSHHFTMIFDTTSHIPLLTDCREDKTVR